MKRYRALLIIIEIATLALLFWAILLPAYQDSSDKPLSNADVIALLKAGLGDDVVIAKITQAKRQSLDVSPEVLIKLKEDGVSTKVIEAMVKRAGQPDSDRDADVGASGKRRSRREPAQPSPPATAKVSAKVLTLAPMPETSQSQNKGGVNIAVTPVQYTAELDVVRRDLQMNPSFLQRLQMPSPNSILIQRTETPILKVTPDRLVFIVDISNQMSRVFRGAGILVQFNVAGKMVPVDQAGYADLTTALIAPRGQQRIKIYGPLLGGIPEQAAIGFFLYDVVTNIDAGGNVSDKQNFEWYYQYAVQLKEAELPAPKPQLLWITPRDPR